MFPFFSLVFKTESSGYLSVSIDSSFHVEVLQRGHPKCGVPLDISSENTSQGSSRIAGVLEYFEREYFRGVRPKGGGPLNSSSRGSTSEGSSRIAGVLRIFR